MDAGAARVVDASTLDERDADILSFERRWWRYAGAKEDAVRDLFGMTATQYYQVLNALIDTPGALAHDPMLVKRLRRMRAARQRGRHAGADEA
ncbi:hypothetical protein Lsed01_00596 [Demequina sediminis]|uniref:DUF3263 domain-containing protein n=1 Tax=Demequina sediminis TaxID=1930058 RepID=A0ABP9WHE2_9MICO|nr:DUF3263 domain-containing protein [Demequina sediminis]BDZ61955.1 hypothetical protein GCM10025873_17460 [Demequina sediminis]